MWLSLANLATSRITDQRETSFGDLREIGHFSFDITDEFVPDQSQQKYYRSPERFIGFDLNDGGETFLRRETPDVDYQDLEKVLQWIALEPSKIDDVEFVTRRRLLSKLCLTPFMSLEKHQSWDIKVVYFKGKYYLDNASKAATPADVLEYNDLRSRDYRAFKFEQLSSSAEPDGDPKTDVSVNNIERYYRVLTAKISTGDVSKHSILFSAQADCCKSNNECVELKTYTVMEGKIILWFVKLKWWIQSHLGDTPHTVCGILTNDGKLKEVQEFKTADFLWDNETGRLTWDRECFGFLTNFLQEIKNRVTADNPCALFKFKGGNQPNPVQYRFVNLEEHNLPEWYRDIMQ